jgi:hypothetical protein
MTNGFAVKPLPLPVPILSTGRYVLDHEDRRGQGRSAWRPGSSGCPAHWNGALGMRSRSARCGGSCSRAHAARMAPCGQRAAGSGDVRSAGYGSRWCRTSQGGAAARSRPAGARYGPYSRPRCWAQPAHPPGLPASRHGVPLPRWRQHIKDPYPPTYCCGWTGSQSVSGLEPYEVAGIVSGGPGGAPSAWPPISADGPTR